MKIIDLLNKIANNEEMPKKIKYANKIFEWYEWNNEICDYVYSGSEGLLNSGEYDLFAMLNKEVEIIEEDKEIEEINVWYEFDGKNNDEIIYHMCTELKDKINKLIKIYNEQIKVFNELKKGK